MGECARIFRWPRSPDAFLCEQVQWWLSVSCMPGAHPITSGTLQMVASRILRFCTDRMLDMSSRMVEALMESAADVHVDYFAKDWGGQPHSRRDMQHMGVSKCS